MTQHTTPQPAPMLSVPVPTFLENATPATRPLRMSAKAGPPLLPGLIAVSCVRVFAREYVVTLPVCRYRPGKRGSAASKGKKQRCCQATIPTGCQTTTASCSHPRRAEGWLLRQDNAGAAPQLQSLKRATNNAGRRASALTRVDLQAGEAARLGVARHAHAAHDA